MSTPANVKGMLGDAALDFLGNLIAAKQNGEQLPKALDAVASVAIQGENKAIEIVKEQAKKETMERLSWIIAGILFIIVVVLIAKRQK